MGHADRSQIQHEIENEKNKLSRAGYARVELLQHGDAPMIEPGQLIPRFVFVDPVGGREGRARREAYE